MGREATCDCTFHGTTAKVKALLESQELILRGNIRVTAPLNSLTRVRVESDALCFNLDKHPMQLHLGAKAAETWAKKIKTPPPTVADKLGITGKIVRTIGPIADPTLDSAICSAAQVRAEDPDFIISLIDTPEALATTLRDAKKQLARSIPLWLVYRKGTGHPINEAHIRSNLRALGYMDTKVASVSPELTALRFNLAKPS